MDDVLARRLRWSASGKVKAEQARLDREAAEIRSLREQVEQWVGCAMYDATMEGPVFKGWDRSALDRCRKRHEDKETGNG
jgi:hypothetical protein